MSNTAQEVYEYYRKQPECLDSMLTRGRELTQDFVRCYQNIRPEAIYLFGSGTSYNACKAAARFWAQVLNVPVAAYAPTEETGPLKTKALAVIVSQEGTSTNTLARIEKLRKSGIATVAFTADGHSPAAVRCNFSVDIGIGPEKPGPKTYGYTATVMALYLAGLFAGRSAGTISAEVFTAWTEALEKAAANAPENQRRCMAFYLANRAGLLEASNYIFAGKGCAAAVAAEGALKVLEMLFVPAAGYEFEEFLHGPACCLGGASALILSVPGGQDPDAARMEKLARIAQGASRNIYLLRHGGTPSSSKELCLDVPDMRYLEPFSDIFFAQLICCRIAMELKKEMHPAVANIFEDMDTKHKQG